MSTLAGDGNGSLLDGQGAAAEFYEPAAVSVDDGGNVYVADSVNQRIRKIDPAGNVTTIDTGFFKFSFPAGVSVDGYGNVFVADGCQVDQIQPDGGAYALTGEDSPAGCGYQDGDNAYAGFMTVGGLVVDALENVYVADPYNERVRMVSGGVDGGTITVAGNGHAGLKDDPDGGISPLTTMFSSPSGVASDGHGHLYVADQTNCRIRRIDVSNIDSDPTSVTTTTFAGNGTAGFADGTGGQYGTAEFNYPLGVAVDLQGNVYVADSSNHRIRMIDPTGQIVTTLAGSGVPGYQDGNNDTAQFRYPTGVAVDANGVVYVADQGNNRIRTIVTH